MSAEPLPDEKPDAKKRILYINEQDALRVHREGVIVRVDRRVRPGRFFMLVRGNQVDNGTE